METPNINWWYEYEGERKGPVKKENITTLIHTGVLTRDNLIWQQGTEYWVNIKNSQFSGYFKTDAPPPLRGDAVNNKIVWWLAFAPLIGQFIEGVFLELFYPEPDLNYESLSSINNYTHYLTNTNFNAFWFVTLGLNIFLSYRDEKKLKEAGYDTAKLGAAFLIPIYLYKRAEMLKQNNAYFWVWLGLFILTIIA